jgi:hypothetical protein
MTGYVHPRPEHERTRMGLTSDARISWRHQSHKDHACT